MNKKEINSNLDILQTNEETLNKEAESMIALREKLIVFMKANNLNRLELDDFIIDLNDNEE